MKKRAAIITVVLMAAVPAIADPIDNPGNFVWDTGGGDLVFNQSSPVTGTVGTVTNGLDIDLDSQGNITFNTISFAAVTSASLSPYTITLLVSTGSNGKIIASDPDYNSTFDLAVRVRVIGNGITGNGCTTDAVTLDFEGAYTYDAFTYDGSLEIYSGTGGSVGGTSGWVTIPELTGGCSGQEATINALLGLGVTGESLNVVRLGATTNPGPRGS